MSKPRMVQVRFVQSRHNPAILAAFRGDVGIKLTMLGFAGEHPPGSVFNANDANWEDIPPERADDAMQALAAVFGPGNVHGPGYTPA